MFDKIKVKELKEKLNDFFNEMRKYGYTAKQNFWCCQNCAWNALSDKESKKVVFYHQQDNDDIKEFGFVFIAWKGNGKFIEKNAIACGLDVDWNGRKDTRMKLS